MQYLLIILSLLLWGCGDSKKNIALNDTILKKKITYIKKNLLEIDPEFKF